MGQGTTESAEGTRRRVRRRDPGEGALFQRGDGRWVGRLKTPDGKTHFLYGRTKAAAKARLVEALRALERGRSLPDHRETFGAYLTAWVEGLGATGLKPASRNYYARYVKYHLLTSELARKPLSRLEPADLRRFYAEKLASGLSSTSVHHLHATIHVALNQALIDGKVQQNAASLVGRSARPKVRARQLTTIAEGDQPRRFLLAAHGERLEALFVLALTTGMRQGELRALHWKDADLDRGLLAVTGSLMGTSRAAMSIGTPKSGKNRSVALSPTAVKALEEHRDRQRAERELVGDEWRGHDLVFCTEFGDFLPTNTIVLALQRILVRAGLPRIRFHDLRHTAATLMLREGVHPKMASEMLGHSAVAITLDLYSHVTPQMHRQAAESIERALGDSARAARP